MKSEQNECFNASWRSKKPCSSSWATEVLNDFDGYGDLYLSKINEWFNNYPEKPKCFKSNLENHDNRVHRAAVNELFWYNLALQLNWKLTAIPVVEEKDEHRPDFEITSPIPFNCEITTLHECGGKFSFEKELTRIYGKWTDDGKKGQIEWSKTQNKPHVLIVFDYSDFSGLGSQHHQSLPDFFQNPKKGNKILPSLPSGLSAILYLERYVEKGKFMLRMSKSICLPNTRACFPIDKNIFNWIDQKIDLQIE